MAKHTYTKYLIYMIWATKNRKKVLKREVRKQLSNYFYEYARNFGRGKTGSRRRSQPRL
jgi:REP element-mobilizing transposase RayT